MRGHEPFPFAQTNRFTAAMRKLLSIKGEEYGVGFGVHLEEERAEYGFLKGERRFTQFNQVTSDAAHRCIVGVGNPIGSNVLTVITSAFCYVEAAGVTLNLMGVTGIAFATGPMFSTDSRGTGGPFSGATSSLGVATGAAGVLSGHIYSQLISLAANDLIDFVGGVFGPRVHSFVLAPGCMVLIATDAVGVHTLSGTFVGYERSLESGELV